MKKTIVTALVLAAFMSRSQAQDSLCRITVELKGLTSSARVYLVRDYGMDVQRTLDSAAVQDGKFMTKAKAADMPVRAEIVVDHNGQGLARLGRRADMLVVYLEKGQLVVSGEDSIKYATVMGSRVNTEYADYKAKVLDGPQKVLDAADDEFMTAPDSRKKDTAFVQGIMDRVKHVFKQIDSLKYVYIHERPDSYFSLTALEEVAGQDIDPSKIAPLFNSLSQRVRGTTAGLAFEKKLHEVSATSIGAIAPNFVQKDVRGRPVKLSDFRGKYVLLDFWASWCGPCRGENPNVVKAFQRWKGKNFTVLGVSLDSKKDAWLAAIRADRLSWTQVSDLQSWNNSAARQYGITAIPQNFLIDPKGKIVGKNLRGDALEERLKELL